MSTREQLSTTVNKKFYDVLRRHAYTMRLNQNDVLELYQNAYLEKIEKQKAEKKMKKDN
jgi:hypothetical protein